jgi:hypothetical protein
MENVLEKSFRFVAPFIISPLAYDKRRNETKRDSKLRISAQLMVLFDVGLLITVGIWIILLCSTSYDLS